MPVKNGRYVPCEYCGNTIYRTQYQYNKRKHHFCSNRCRAEKQRLDSADERTCEVCGEKFVVKRSSPQRFCSIECQHLWQKQNVGERNPKFRGGYVRCEQCGAEYLVGEYKLESPAHHFCSTECRQRWYATVWSQSDEWKERSRRRAVDLLSNGSATTMTKPQALTNELLTQMGVAFRNEEPFVYYSVDNYLPDHNLVIEVMGDYWHASPLRYKDCANEMQRRVVSRDKAKHTFISAQYNIEILYLWEGDVVKRPLLCRELIHQYISSGGHLPNYHSFNYGLDDGRLRLNDYMLVPHQDAA